MKARQRITVLALALLIVPNCGGPQPGSNRATARLVVDGHFTKWRTILTLPARTGEINNIVLGADGRMLMGISAPCDHCAPSSKLSGAIIAFRPDGTDLRVYASAIRAPVGLAYFPDTHDLFVTMNQRDDLGAKTPGDWLAVVSEGTAWGFPDCYGQGGSICRDVPRPTAVLDKHAAAAGVAIATGQLGSAVGTAALVAEWATGTVLRVALQRNGSAYKSTVAPLLTGVEQPVVLLLGRDGAMLVGDWTSGRSTGSRADPPSPWAHRALSSLLLLHS